MDKLILIFYIPSGDKTPEELHYIFQGIAQQINKDDGILYYLFPTTEENPRVECVNPKLVTAEEYQKVEVVLTENQKLVKEFLDRSIDDSYDSCEGCEDCSCKNE